MKAKNRIAKLERRRKAYDEGVKNGKGSKHGQEMHRPGSEKK